MEVLKKLLFAVFPLLIISFNPTKSEVIKRSEYLDTNEKYYVEWEVDFNTNLVTFNVQVETTGYVGFGVSPGPSMAGADIVIGGVHPNGSSYFGVSASAQCN